MSQVLRGICKYFPQISPFAGFEKDSYDSNRETETLEWLISLLEDEKHANTARLLLTRYTNESFQRAEQWQSWFESNKDRIYFTDVGGYKFLVVPPGYLDKKKPAAVRKVSPEN